MYKYLYSLNFKYLNLCPMTAINLRATISVLAFRVKGQVQVTVRRIHFYSTYRTV